MFKRRMTANVSDVMSMWMKHMRRVESAVLKFLPLNQERLCRLYQQTAANCQYLWHALHTYRTCDYAMY